MDWGAVSGIALAMAAITLIMDWVMQYWLVIRWGPNITQELVIAKFKDRKVAAEVREALDLPTRAETQALTDKLHQLDTIFSVKMAEILGKVDAFQGPDMDPILEKVNMIGALSDKIEEIASKPFEVPADMVDDIADGIESRIAGKYGSELKAERKQLKSQAEELQAEYLNSPEWEAENKDRILAVQQHTPGKSYALARAAVKRGPKFVDSMARANLTRGEYTAFRELYDEIDNAPREGPVSAGSAGGWLTR